MVIEKKFNTIHPLWIVWIVRKEKKLVQNIKYHMMCIGMLLETLKLFLYWNYQWMLFENMFMKKIVNLFGLIQINASSSSHTIAAGAPRKHLILIINLLKKTVEWTINNSIFSQFYCWHAKYMLF